MIKTIRAVGISHRIIIDKATLKLLGLKDGAQVNVGIAPDGSGILLTPVAADAKIKPRTQMHATAGRARVRRPPAASGEPRIRGRATAVRARARRPLLVPTELKPQVHVAAEQVGASPSPASAEHKARVRAAGDEILKRHGSAFKKLAE